MQLQSLRWCLETAWLVGERQIWKKQWMAKVKRNLHYANHVSDCCFGSPLSHHNASQCDVVLWYWQMMWTAHRFSTYESLSVKESINDQDAHYLIGNQIISQSPKIQEITNTKHKTIEKSKRYTWNVSYCNGGALNLISGTGALSRRIENSKRCTCTTWLWTN
jgi:hypothetical protein